ncbi:hypothetical protein [Herbaspirillum rubrisubalbicans]|jgi:hypothetical protein|uniref:NAD-GH domain containing protein n=1 Tax=Herbaspirillum rubrisubalbicans Os34 TaxID=1235827 RepID=A0A6M3ZU93_9BURK|nr:hypothetical protein [Herbaspirillum rubrisubalbicans]QJQ02137.1 NAD-GH domain containing protein [Herbaspirillum rubrisubalbicans Os34]
MNNMIKALAASLTVALALAACATPVQRTASGEIPPARIYIKSMTEQAAGLSQVEFSRSGGLLNNELLELSINDVVLAQIAGGEHLSIWLKPGSYDFSVKRINTLTEGSAPTQHKLTLQVNQSGAYKIQISTELRGLTIQLMK